MGNDKGKDNKGKGRPKGKVTQLRVAPKGSSPGDKTVYGVPTEVVLGPKALATLERIRSMPTAQRRYTDPEEMAGIIKEYFDYCYDAQQPPLITTLTLALGFANRESLGHYEARAEFRDLISRARLVCEDFAAKGLIMGKNTVGFIFLLKQYGWKDSPHESIVTVESHEQRIARLIKNNMGGGE